MTLEFTGPLWNEDGYQRADWGPVWFNSTIKCIRVDSIAVTFMDGKSKTLSAWVLRGALGESAKNTCTARLN